MSKEQITPEQIWDAAIKWYQHNERMNYIPETEEEYREAVGEQQRELSQFVPPNKEQFCSKYGLSAMEENNRLIADIQDAIGGLFAVIEEHGVDTIIASSGDPGAVKDCLLSAKEVLKRLDKYGLSTPVTDEIVSKPQKDKDADYQDGYATGYHDGYYEKEKPEAVTDEQLQNDLDELIEAVLNDKLYGTSAPGTGRPHDPDPAISEIKERILRKHSVTPVLSDMEQIKKRAQSFESATPHEGLGPAIFWEGFTAAANRPVLSEQEIKEAVQKIRFSQNKESNDKLIEEVVMKIAALTVKQHTEKSDI